MMFLKYTKDLPYSYVFGAFGTIELIKNKAKECLAVLVDPSFTSNDAYKTILSICKTEKIQVIVDKNIVNKLKDKGNIFVIGVFKKYNSPLSNDNHLVIYKNNDIGSIGTIIRSMRGFGFINLVLVDCDIDLYHEHLVRSTMGAFFQTNIKQYDTLTDYINDYKGKTFINISNEGEVLSTIEQKNNVSLIFSSNSISHKELINVSFNQNIPMENIVNIVLFTLYKD